MAFAGIAPEVEEGEDQMVKIFADGANLEQMLKLNPDPQIAGFTTNPSLMRKNGVTDYVQFARKLLESIKKPISFEVFADDFDEMDRQARLIASWGENVYVKIPVTDTKGNSSHALVRELLKSGVKVNLTAVFTVEQVNDLASSFTLPSNTPAILSIFAGRIADAGANPMPICRTARRQCSGNVEILWASAREVYNVRQAEICGCDIITLGSDLIAKLPLIGKDLTKYSLETVRQFHSDALAAGYQL
jgi:transaldolase